MKKLYWVILSLLCFVFCGFLYITSHPEIYCPVMAEYYYSRNNISKAVEFYEQAFDSGYKSSEARMAYVNLIINSPLDVDAQNRLVKFIKYNVDDAAKYKAESFLAELRYEIHRKYPDNYISQTTYNQKIIRWSHNPITYNFYNVHKTPEYFLNEINNAFSIWETNSDGKIKFKRVGENPDIVIRFNSKKMSVEDMGKYIVAYTKPSIHSDTLKNMVMDFYLTSPDGDYFTPNQIFNTALHEIGHAIGIMGHSNRKKSVMYMTTDMATVTNDVRKSLTDSDISTLKLLYATKPDITDKQSNDSEYTSYLVIGNTDDVANAKIREAKNYIKNAPNLPSGYIDLADAYVALADYPRAVKSLNKALTLTDNNEILTMIYYNLSVAYYLMNDYSQAKIYLEKSGSMQKSESAKQLLAEIYYGLGDKNNAVAAYEDLIISKPSNIEYIIALTNIYVRDKHYLKARAVLKEFILKNPDERYNPKLAPYGILKAFL